MGDINLTEYEKYSDDGISLSDSINDLFESYSKSSTTDSNQNSKSNGNDLLSLMGGFGDTDLKSMFPQLIMSILGNKVGKHGNSGKDFSSFFRGINSLGNDYDYDEGFLEHQKIFNEHIKAKDMGNLRGVLPYLEPSLQRHFAIYIKLVELQSVVGYYSKNTLPYVVRDENWQRNMLLSMRYNSKKTNQYDKILKMFDMYKIIGDFGGIR